MAAFALASRACSASDGVLLVAPGGAKVVSRGGGAAPTVTVGLVGTAGSAAASAAAGSHTGSTPANIITSAP